MVGGAERSACDLEWFLPMTSGLSDTDSITRVCVLSHLSHFWLFATPRTVAC